MDLIMGRFADVALGDLAPSELDAFEALLEQPDPDLYSWVSGESVPPPEADTSLFRRLRAFHTGLEEDR